MKTKLVANIVVNIVLLTLYVFLFGKESVNKYLDEGIIIVTHEEKMSFIKPPGYLSSQYRYNIVIDACFSHHHISHESPDWMGLQDMCSISGS